jgi:hypothetical protein
MKARIRSLPISVSHDVAQKVAPELTRLAGDSFDARRNVYGDAWPKSVSLVRTGTTRRMLGFDASGTVVRSRLGAPYMKFLIGKYKILPIGDRTAMPTSWAAAVRKVVDGVMSSVGLRRAA